MVINFTAGGELIQVFPNRYNPNSLIEANREYSVPASSMDFSLEVTGPAGTELLIAFASEKPINLLDADYKDADFFSVDINDIELLYRINENITKAKASVKGWLRDKMARRGRIAKAGATMGLGTMDQTNPTVSAMRVP